MSRLTVDIPDPLDHFIAEQVASGAYADSADVVRASLRRFKSQAEAEISRTERFLAAVDVGLSQIGRGETVRVDDVAALLDDIEQEIDAATAHQAA